jgi:hypothetical protein
MAIDAERIADTLNRMVKLALDTGEAESLKAARALFAGYRLQVSIGPEAARNPGCQIALLTIVNTARRCFLGGVSVDGDLGEPLGVAFPGAATLREAVRVLGGRSAPIDLEAPLIVLGDPAVGAAPAFAVRATFEGWAAGCAPLANGARLAEREVFGPAAVAAGALAVTEAFQYVRGSNPAAGRRSYGLSLWRPDVDWLDPEAAGRPAVKLPSKAWLIGLGNLGQAYLWSLGFLPYPDPAALSLVLQDFDILAGSNDSTSLLTQEGLIGKYKSRAMADWAEARGFQTRLVERRFEAGFRVNADEPQVALSGVDNPAARRALEDVGFVRVLEAGLGEGVSDFLGIRLHSFPAKRSARAVWPEEGERATADVDKPAYLEMAEQGADECGLTLLAGRTVGAPFVGAVAGALIVAELVRLANGEHSFELVDLHLRSPGLATAIEQDGGFAFNPGGVAVAPAADA